MTPDLPIDTGPQQQEAASPHMLVVRSLQRQMPALPKTIIGRALALLWLLACFGLLLFAFVQRGVHDMPMAFTSLLIALTFPIGLPVGAIVGIPMSQAYAKFGLPYSPFLDLLPSWLVMVSFGYLQWFVVVPGIGRRLLRGKRGI